VKKDDDKGKHEVGVFFEKLTKLNIISANQ